MQMTIVSKAPRRSALERDAAKMYRCYNYSPDRAPASLIKHSVSRFGDRVTFDELADAEGEPFERFSAHDPLPPWWPRVRPSVRA